MASGAQQWRVSLPALSRPHRSQPAKDTDSRATELQRQLAGLSAPGRLVDWARPFSSLESCWKACPYPECLLWLAATTATTAAERRAVVSCLAEITRRAGRGRRKMSPAVEHAVRAAETWVEAEGSLEDLLAAEHAALDAVEAAAVLAASEAARARALFRSAPRRGRPASYRTSQALGACAEFREAEQDWRLALAAAGAARAAARGAEASTPEAAAPEAAAPGADAPEAVAPEADAPRADAPRVDTPEAVAPEADSPKADPRADAPEAGQRRADPPEAGESKKGDEAGLPAGEPATGPGSWAACVSESAGYAISALAGRRSGERAGWAARKSARLIRRRLPCPAMSGN
jgi:hypothetical protein